MPGLLLWFALFIVIGKDHTQDLTQVRQVLYRCSTPLVSGVPPSYSYLKIEGAGEQTWVATLGATEGADVASEAPKPRGRSREVGF